jgi:hypothetical protein
MSRRRTIDENHSCLKAGGQVCLPKETTVFSDLDDTAFASVGFLLETVRGAFSGPNELSLDGPWDQTPPEREGPSIIQFDA